MITKPFSSARPGQPLNAVGSIVVQVSGIIIFLNPVQPQKVSLSIAVTLAGRTTEANAVQLSNALAPSDIRFSGKTMAFLQPVW